MLVHVYYRMDVFVATFSRWMYGAKLGKPHGCILEFTLIVLLYISDSYHSLKLYYKDYVTGHEV